MFISKRMNQIKTPFKTLPMCVRKQTSLKYLVYPLFKSHYNFDNKYEKWLLHSSSLSRF